MKIEYKDTWFKFLIILMYELYHISNMFNKESCQEQINYSA
jgi:hypothetical protein